MFVRVKFRLAHRFFVQHAELFSQLLLLLASLRGFEVPFRWLLKLVFLINKEGKIHEFFGHRSAQAATFDQ